MRMLEIAGGTRLPSFRADALATALVWGAAALISAMFLWIVLDLLRNGLPLLSWSFLTDAPRDAGRAGGILPIVVSTLWIMAVCLGVSLPLGLGTALLLSEFSASDGRFVRSVRTSLDVLAGVPSIVFGLFGNAFFCVMLGLGFSILSGGLTLACMALPLLIRATEEGLRSVPNDYRMAAAALGMSRARTIWSVLLPAASPGLVAGVVLGVGRAIAETAALIFTSGYVDRMPTSWLDSGRALSIHIYDLSMNVPGAESSAYASALVLLVVLLIINGCVLHLQERWVRRSEATA
jgi:phosphate transport system permease protein